MKRILSFTYLIRFPMCNPVLLLLLFPTMYGCPSPAYVQALLIESESNDGTVYLGADMSYVQEMEACGADFIVDGQPMDPFGILYEQGANMVRLRLWHTPAWYDTLNEGRRYSDLADVEKAIQRAHDADMEVLLDLHLSDRWADPHHQAVPAAWLPVVHDTDLLGDSLYQYVYGVMTGLAQKGLWPEMVQVGNEVNKGILLSPEADSSWTLDWPRNAALFNRAIAAVRDAERDASLRTGVMLHVADPTNAEWMLDGFREHGVLDFDWIGLSYYWAWHHPTTIAECGTVIQTLRHDFPSKEVMLVETGYPWTDAWNDNATNIISELHPDYAPASPDAQFRWLHDLTAEVLSSGGRGVLYWEPFWISTPCHTPWGQGSHQEHATFFDFDNKLITNGGVRWMGEAWSDPAQALFTPLPLSNPVEMVPWRILVNAFSSQFILRYVGGKPPKKTRWTISDKDGLAIRGDAWTSQEITLDLTALPPSIYVLRVEVGGQEQYVKQFRLGED